MQAWLIALLAILLVYSLQWLAPAAHDSAVVVYANRQDSRLLHSKADIERLAIACSAFLEESLGEVHISMHAILDSVAGDCHAMQWHVVV